MTFEEFLEEKNLTTENTPGSEYALMKEAYNAGYESVKNTLLEEVKQLRKDYAELLEENEQLEKNSLVWHRTDFEEPDDLPLEDMQKCLILARTGHIRSATFWRCDDGRCSFEGYNWKEIEAWAELPEVKL